MNHESEQNCTGNPLTRTPPPAGVHIPPPSTSVEAAATSRCVFSSSSRATPSLWWKLSMCWFRSGDFPGVSAAPLVRRAEEMLRVFLLLWLQAPLHHGSQRRYGDTDMVQPTEWGSCCWRKTLRKTTKQCLEELALVNEKESDISLTFQKNNHTSHERGSLK